MNCNSSVVTSRIRSRVFVVTEESGHDINNVIVYDDDIIVQ